MCSVSVCVFFQLSKSCLHFVVHTAERLLLVLERRSLTLAPFFHYITHTAYSSERVQSSFVYTGGGRARRRDTRLAAGGDGGGKASCVSAGDVLKAQCAPVNVNSGGVCGHSLGVVFLQRESERTQPARTL
jgi:hypothetical protein